MKQDIALYNEATGWTIHTGEYGGRPREQAYDQMEALVREHLIVPLELVQDDPINVRVTTGNLTPAEEGEWVNRVVARLKIPGKELILEGGFVPAVPTEDFLEIVKVKPGDYLVEVFTLFWGINGEYCSSSKEVKEPVGSWFRRTRPGKRFPAVLKSFLAEEAEDEDPGYEEYWDKYAESEAYDELEVPDQLDFIVRLTPWKDEYAAQFSKTKDGWFPIDGNVRKPELCPIGLKANL